VSNYHLLTTKDCQLIPQICSSLSPWLDGYLVYIRKAGNRSVPPGGKWERGKGRKEKGMKAKKRPRETKGMDKQYIEKDRQEKGEMEKRQENGKTHTFVQGPPTTATRALFLYPT